MMGTGERMLIKKTKSLCPTCGNVLDADVVEEEGKVWLVRTCPDHGTYRALYWSDAEMYRRFDAFESIGGGISNPHTIVSPQGVRTIAASAQIIDQRRCLPISI